MNSTTSVEVSNVSSLRDRKEIRGQIVLDLLQDYKFVTMLNKELYVYDNREGSRTCGIWRRELAEKIIVERIERVLRLDATRYDKDEIISHITDRTYHNESNDALFWDESPKDVICVANGVLDVNTERLIEHSPEYRFLAKIPVEYIPRDDPRLKGKDRIDRFLHEILSTEEDVKAQYEWAGYCLYRSHLIHKLALLVGEGANGKSTWINVLSALLGRENVSSIDLHSLCYNRFSIANLQGKFANTYADLSENALKHTGVLKMLTGGDILNAERKFVQGRVDFVNSAKLIFSCNMIPPSTSDDTIAFWRRWNITKFSKVFDEEIADKRILEKLIPPLELSSLLNNALDGLRRLLKNGRFSNYKNVEETRAEYIARSDPIWGFAEECLIMESEAYEVKADVYEAYKDYCKQHTFVVAPSNIFSRDLKKYVAFTHCQRTIKLKRGVPCYSGIRLKIQCSVRVGSSSTEASKEKTKSRRKTHKLEKGQELLQGEIAQDNVETHKAQHTTEETSVSSSKEISRKPHPVGKGYIYQCYYCNKRIADDEVNTTMITFYGPTRVYNKYCHKKCIDRLRREREEADKNNVLAQFLKKHTKLDTKKSDTKEKS